MEDKILFDLSFVLSPTSVYTGVAKYAYRILEYIVKDGRQDRYMLLLNENSAGNIRQMFPQFEYHIIGKKWMRRTLFFKFFFYMYEFRKAVNRIGANLVFCPYGGSVACLKVHSKKVSVIHDLQVRIDARYKKKRDVWLSIFAEDKLLNNSEYVLSISDFSRNQILSFYPWAENKVINMSNSVSMVRRDDLQPMQPGYKYLLYCGRLYVQKNVMTLVRAFKLLSSSYADLKLVLIGKDGDYWQNTIKPYADENGILNRIVLTGFCSEEDLSRWYLGATCFVFPSVREGFGFPPIEAAYMQVPVVSSKADSLEEVTLGLLNYYEPPLDETKLADAVKRVIDNPPSKQQLQNISNEFEKCYSIDVVGKRICDFLEKENQGSAVN